MIVQVPPAGSVPSVHVTNVPTSIHEPALVTMPVMAKEPNAGSVSVTCRFCASDGPLLVTVMT